MDKIESAAQNKEIQDPNDIIGRYKLNQTLKLGEVMELLELLQEKEEKNEPIKPLERFPTIKEEESVEEKSLSNQSNGNSSNRSSLIEGSVEQSFE